MFEIHLDDEKSVVQATISGVMTVSEARRFYAEVCSLAKVARARHGAFRLIADTSNAPVQPQEVLSELPSPAGIIAGADDRWAVIVSSSLSKIQASRILAHPQAKAFLSPSAAETWARAFSETGNRGGLALISL